MILDAHNLYSDAQALTTTAASTNIVDHGADRDIGIGEPMVVVISLDVAADAGNADETYSVDLQVDDNSGFSSATSIGSVTITRGDAAGTKYYIPVKPDSSFEQFSRLNYTLGGTTPSVTLTAELMPMSMIQNDQVYADNITIS